MTQTTKEINYPWQRTVEVATQIALRKNNKALAHKIIDRYPQYIKWCNPEVWTNCIGFIGPVTVLCEVSPKYCSLSNYTDRQFIVKSGNMITITSLSNLTFKGAKKVL